MEPERTGSRSTIVIDGVAYLTAAQVARSVGVSRQTLWRWRQEGKVPIGRKYRDQRVVFTTTESDLVRIYAQRLEPIQSEGFGGCDERGPFGAKEASHGDR